MRIRDFDRRERLPVLRQNLQLGRRPSGQWSERDAVDQDERLDAGWVGGQQLRDAAARRMPDRREAIHTEMVEKLLEVGGLRTDVECGADRGFPEAPSPSRSGAITRWRPASAGINVAPQVRRQREPVQQEHGRAGALVVVGELAARGRRNGSRASPHDGVGDAQRANRLRHVVHADHVGAVRGRQHRGGDRPSTRVGGVLDAGQRRR